MAGIGFVLKKLANQDNLMGLMRSFSHSAIASTGPWLFTILMLSGIMILGQKHASIESIFSFRLVVIYNFAFSLVLSAPITLISTRNLADLFYFRDASPAIGLLFSGLVLTYVVQLPVAYAFYFGYTTLDPVMALSAVVNFLLISTIWMVSIFLSALKNFKAVTRAFLWGTIFTIVASVELIERYGTMGMLNGFNAGLTLILAMLTARIFAEYPYRILKPFALFPYFKQYWDLALAAVISGLAIWVDKWIMWMAPQAEINLHGFFFYANYDSAMFLAYLTIVPSLAAFMFTIETNFFEYYVAFYQDIQQKATYAQVEINHQNIMKSFYESCRTLLVLQGSISLTAILSANQIFDFLGVNYGQLSIFRYGVVGALFQVFTMFMLIMLGYFDVRKKLVFVYTLFLVLNGVFTYVVMGWGVSYYGLGYLFANVVVFVVTAIIAEKYIRFLPYHTFITSNKSIMTGN